MGGAEHREEVAGGFRVKRNSNCEGSPRLNLVSGTFALMRLAFREETGKKRTKRQVEALSLLLLFDPHVCFATLFYVPLSTSAE